MVPGTPCLQETHSTQHGVRLSAQHASCPQLTFFLSPAPPFSIPIPPRCWLCQVVGLVYMALFPLWLSAALPEMS